MIARVKPLAKYIFLFFVSKKLRAKKKPTIPEQRACKKVAEINLKPAKVIVSPIGNKNTLGDKKIKRFSKATKPKAAIII